MRRRTWAALILAVSIQACVNDPSDDASPDGPLPSPEPTSDVSPAVEPELPACPPGFGPCGGSRPHIVFRDVTRRAFDMRLRPRDTWGALWADYDGNGYPDLFIGRHEDAPDFLANDGGRYSPLEIDFVRPPGYEPLDGERGVDRHSCAWGEADGDGEPDLYCDVGANRGTGLGPNMLLLQRDDGFEDVAGALGVSYPYGRSKSVNWLDHDGDGDLDLFVGNALRFDRSTPNVLFERTDTGFAKADVGLDDRLVTMSSSWADWDLDGDPDLLVLMYPSSSKPAVAYENVDGSFRRIEVPHVTGGPWHAATWGDYDGDGRPDLALVSIEGLTILRNTRSGLRPAFSTALGKGQMAVWFDAENDGDLDLFVMQGAPPPMEWYGANIGDLLVVRERRGFRRVNLASLRGPRDGCGDSSAVADHDRDGRVDLFITNGAEGGCRGMDVLLENDSPAGYWVAVDLRGDPDNPWGIGARIHVRAGDLAYWRQLTDGINFRSQSEIGHQVFGIGSNPSAKVRVVWPDGTSDCVSIEATATAPVTKGASPCAALDR
jgi:VCBS repeat protein/ASPIC/UnbV protein